MLSVVFVDVLWPFFLLLGLEHVRIDPGNTAVTPFDLYDYPISHSLVTGIGWALLFGAVYLAVTGYRRGALVLAAGVLSHWVLDFITHRPDMPILPNNHGPKVGLGLWNSIPGTLIVETLIFAAGITIYLQTTRPKDRVGSWGFAAFMAFLFLAYMGNIFGPPPPDERTLAIAAASTSLLFFFPYWIDRHRSLR